MPYTMPGAMATVTASLFKRIPLKPDAGPGLRILGAQLWAVF